MKQKIKKTIKCKAYTKEDFDRDYERTLKRSVMFPTDFQKIEDAPRSTFDKEVQEKIAVEPVGAGVLIGEEQEEFLQRMLESDLLPKIQKLCFELVMEGQRPIDVAKLLGITNVAVHLNLKRATSKLKRAYQNKLLGENPQK